MSQKYLSLTPVKQTAIEINDKCAWCEIVNKLTRFFTGVYPHQYIDICKDCENLARRSSSNAFMIKEALIPMIKAKRKAILGV